VNSAVNRLRDALGDKAVSPRFVETLARRGYRFIAPVERIPLPPQITASDIVPQTDERKSPHPSTPVKSLWLKGILATQEDLPRSSPHVVQALFVLLQLMYLGFYVGALANLAEIGELFSSLAFAAWAFPSLVVTALLLIPVRIFLLNAALFHAPGIRGKFLKIWPLLLVADGLWSLAPLLLLHHINYGLAFACITPLVYAPFAQRSLILMGAGARAPETPGTPA
jgi:cholera toxin transcriptional activator